MHRNLSYRKVLNYNWGFYWCISTWSYSYFGAVVGLVW